METKKRFLINITYFSLILIIVFVALKYLFPIISPFIFAFIISSLLQKPISFVSEKTKISRKMSAIIIIVSIILIISIVLFLIGNTVANNIESFISFIAKKIENLPAILENVKQGILNLSSRLPNIIKTKIEEYTNNFLEIFFSSENGSTNSPMDSVFGFAKKLPSILLGVLIGIISTVFFSIDYQKITSFIVNQLSPKHQNILLAIKKVFFSTILKLLKSYLILMFITFAQLAATFYLMKIFNVYKTDYVILISALIALIDIVPILGTGAILIPWAIYSLITNNIAAGVFLLISFAIITISRNILEPKIIGNQVGASPVVTLIFMYIGLKLFGVIGLFVLPIIFIVIKILSDSGKIRIWKKQ